MVCRAVAPSETWRTLGVGRNSEKWCGHRTKPATDYLRHSRGRLPLDPTTKLSTSWARFRQDAQIPCYMLMLAEEGQTNLQGVTLKPARARLWTALQRRSDHCRFYNGRSWYRGMTRRRPFMLVARKSFSRSACVLDPLASLPTTTIGDLESFCSCRLDLCSQQSIAQMG